MKTELCLYELIQRQVAEQEKNYEAAVVNSKPFSELKQMEYHIEYLKSCRRQLEKAYNTSSTNASF